MSSPVERASAHASHLIAAIFRTYVDVDVTVVGVALKRWHKGTNCSDVKIHCYRTPPLSSHCETAATKAAMSSLNARQACLENSVLHSIEVQRQHKHTQCNAASEKVELREHNRQESNTQFLRDHSWDHSWDQRNLTQ